jgi:adenosylcobinamide-GDP ribazoletransferase
MFYTRIPVPAIKGYTDDLLNRATKYFPLIGFVIGGIAALVFWGFQFVMPVSLALLLSMIASIFATGAFHEDGFADFCDGMGGGMDQESILTIMKDSRLGTYGAIGLVMMLAVKYTLLIHLPMIKLPLIILAGHVVSRLIPVILIFTSRYVRNDALSKSKPIGTKGKKADLMVALLFCLPAGLLVAWKIWPVFVVLMGLVFLRFRQYIHKKISGYTGDILGALQQISEILFYLAVLLVYHNNWT